MIMDSYRKKDMDTISTSRIKNLLHGHWPIKAAALVIAIAIGVGGYMLISGKASGFFASVEVDSGTLSGNAKLVSDTSASGGKAVQFTAPVTTPPPVTPPSSRPDPFPASMKPDATNTGLLDSSILTVVNGDQVFGANYNGQIISNKDFHGYVKVSGSNITFKNCMFRGGTPNGNVALLDAENEDKNGKHPAVNLTVEDSTFLPTNRNATVDGMWAENTTVLRVDMSGSTDTIKASNNTTIRDSYLHDLQWYAVDPNTSDGTHNDNVQILDGTNIKVIHNNMNPNSAKANSSVQITQDFGTTGTVLLDSNWADWGGYTFNISQKRNSDLSDTLKTVSVTNNRFGRNGEYGAVKIGTGVTLAAFSGNVWNDNGQPIPQPDKNDN